MYVDNLSSFFARMNSQTNLKRQEPIAAVHASKMSTYDYYQLPVELVETIMENHSNDVEVLAACSLVCRSLSDIARRFRFREIRAGPRDLSGSVTESRSTSLLCNLTSTVLPYVRDLHLDANEQFPAWANATARARRIQILDDILQRIRVDDLTVLDSLRVDYVMWHLLSAPSRLALQRLCRYITSIHIAYPYHGTSGILYPIPCSAIAQLLATAPSLQHFTLVLFPCNRVKLMEEEVSPYIRESLPKIMVLKSLKINDNSASYLSHLPPFFPTIQLKELSITSINGDSVKSLYTFLRSCATTLESLTLNFNHVMGANGQGDSFLRLKLATVMLTRLASKQLCCVRNFKTSSREWFTSAS